MPAVRFVSAHVGAAVHPLLSPPELSAADRQRVRGQRADRDRPRRTARRRAATGRRPARWLEEAAHLPLPDLPGGGSPSRYAGIRFVRGGTLDDPASVSPDVHIYTRSKLPWVVPAGRCSGVCHLLRRREALARRQSRARRCTQGDEALRGHDRLPAASGRDAPQPEPRGQVLQLSLDGFGDGGREPHVLVVDRIDSQHGRSSSPAASTFRPAGRGAPGGRSSPSGAWPPACTSRGCTRSRTAPPPDVGRRRAGRTARAGQSCLEVGAERSGVDAPLALHASTRPARRPRRRRPARAASSCSSALRCPARRPLVSIRAPFRTDDDIGRVHPLGESHSRLVRPAWRSRSHRASSELEHLGDVAVVGPPRRGPRHDARVRNVARAQAARTSPAARGCLAGSGRCRGSRRRCARDCGSSGPPRSPRSLIGRTSALCSNSVRSCSRPRVRSSGRYFEPRRLQATRSALGAIAAVGSIWSRVSCRTIVTRSVGRAAGRAARAHCDAVPAPWSDGARRGGYANGRADCRRDPGTCVRLGLAAMSTRQAAPVTAGNFGWTWRAIRSWSPSSLPRLPARDRKRLRVQAGFKADQVHVVGRQRPPARLRRGGPKEGVFHFCPDCGSQVFITEPADPDLIVVPVGAFADRRSRRRRRRLRPSPSSLG